MVVAKATSRRLNTLIILIILDSDILVLSTLTPLRVNMLFLISRTSHNEFCTTSGIGKGGWAISFYVHLTKLITNGSKCELNSQTTHLL